jgi:hypothetical protein
MEGYIQIPFTYTDGTFNFSDALHLPVDHTFTEEQIEEMKAERFNNWKQFILNPPPPPPEVEEEPPVNPEAPVGNVEA